MTKLFFKRYLAAQAKTKNLEKLYAYPLILPCTLLDFVMSF